MSTLARNIVVFVAMLTAMAANAALDAYNRKLVDSLVIAIASFDERVASREAEIAAMRAARLKLPPGKARVRMGEEIAQQYIVQNIDSAVVYLSLALNDANATDDPHDVTGVEMRLFSIMPLFHVTKEALEGFYNIDYETLPEELKKRYWSRAAEIYHLIHLTYPAGFYKTKYRRLTMEAIDSLITYYPPDSPVAHYLSGQELLLGGDKNLAVANFMEALPRLKAYPELSDYAMRTILAYYKDKPEYRQTYMTYLLQRVLKDLSRGLIRPASVASLGEALIEEGYDALGRKCIAKAMETPDHSYAAVTSGFDRSEYAHFITDPANRMMRRRYVLISVAVLLFGACGWYIGRQKKTIGLLRNEIAEAEQSHVRSEHDAARTNQSLVMLAFLALEQLKDYNVHVVRKLKAGQVKDLYDDVEAGKYLQRQTEKYFEVFDSTFLGCFPGFVDELNKLLLPDKTLALLPGDRLSPELRLAAFMRLGVNDSNKLANALSLSLNTIYTYRNRLRGRALKRDSFEEDLMKIMP